MMHKHIIFDLDGTLIDTSEGIRGSILHVIETLRLPTLDSVALDTFIGPPIQQSFMQHFDMSRNAAEDAVAIFFDHYKSKNILKASVYPGISGLLDALKNAGTLLSVATYKQQVNAVRLLEYFNLDKYFDCIAGVDPVRPESKTDIIKRCIENLKTKPAEGIVYVGDTLNDADSARSVGIFFVGVRYGFGFRRGMKTTGLSGAIFADNAEQLRTVLSEPFHSNIR